MAFLQIWALGQGAHARPMAAKRAPAQDVPSVSAVRRPLIVSNCLTRSAVPAGFRRGPHTRPGRESRRLSRSLRVRAAQDGCEFHRPKRGAALRRQIEEAPWRRPNGHGRRWRNSSVSRRLRSRTTPQAQSALGWSAPLRIARSKLDGVCPHASLVLAAIGLSERRTIPHAERDGNDFFRSRRGGAMRAARRRPLFPRMIASAKLRAEGQAATFTIDQALGTMSSFAAAPTADRWLMDRAGIGFARCFESFG